MMKNNRIKLKGVILIAGGNQNLTIKMISQLEQVEKDKCDLPIIFAEMFKDEINAVDEQRLYNGVKRLLKKFAQDQNALSVLNEYTRVISGGTSIEEIVQIAIDEAQNPTITSDLIADASCMLEQPGEDRKLH